ncbi:MAG TPA: fasciclin domain-containing protein [Gemmatimonadales bacterium]
MHRKSLLSAALVAAVSVPGILAAQEPTVPSQPPAPPTQPAQPSNPSEPAPTARPESPVVTDSAAGDVELKAGKSALADVLAADAELSTFAELAEAAGISEALSSAGPLTILAPSNEAFAKIPADQLEELKADSTRLRAFVLSHVIPGRISSADAATRGNAQSVIGSDVAITAADGKVSVGGAAVTRADVEAGESVIHVIDAVILPAESEAPAAPVPPTDGAQSPTAPSTPAPAVPAPSTPAPSTPPAGTPPAR